MIKTGMMAWATGELHNKDEYGYFQKKGKGKKGKKGKDDEGKGKPGDGKGKSNYVQPQTSSTPAIQNQQQQAYYSTAASSYGYGFVSFCEPNPARLSYQNKETGKRFPVLVGEVDALQRGLQRRPDPVPEKLDFNPVRRKHGRKAHHFSQLDTLTKQRCQISLNALNRQRYHLRRKLETLIR